jgi:hypothetical protein
MTTIKKSLLLFTLFTSSMSFSQTVLGPGDIAFIGFNLDGLDDYAFILLKDIDGATTINFTDCGWNDLGGFSCVAGDAASWTWSANGTPRTCGTVVRITANAPGLTTTVGTVGGTIPVMSGIGDQLFAFQGLPSSPTFISGVHSNILGGTTNDANWDNASSNNQTSALPNTLTNGVDALRLHNAEVEVDNWQYNCAVVAGPAATIRAAINNIANWNNDNGIAYSPVEPPCAWAVVCTTPQEIDIEGNFTSIPDGDVTPSLGDDTDFGTVSIGATATNTFTIQNEGGADLTLSGGPTFVTLTGSALFTVTAQPSSPISAAGSSTFNIQFNAACPNTAGTYNATVSVSSDDADESPYTFDITADITGVDTDSDGALNLCDPDDDNDGILDGSDPDDSDFNICGDSDADGCDDCSVTNDGFGALSDSDPLNDGTDTDCDGICDATDPTDGASQARGQMLTFGGGGDYVNIGDIGLYNFDKTDGFTVEAWINSSSASTAMQIISKYEGDLFNARGWGLQISSSSLAFYMAGGSLFDFMLAVPTGTPNVKDGLWHHVAVVYDGSNNVTGATFYIDGVSYAGIDGGGTVASVIGSPLNSESAAIGAYLGTISGAGEYWDGSLDEVRVWNSQRTQTEIRENLHLSLAGACDASLDGYWKFNSTAGVTAFDLSGNGNDGTHVGAPTIVASQCAVGFGVSTTHSMTATATNYITPAYIPNHDMDLNFATTPPGGEVVVTSIFGLPVGGLAGPEPEFSYMYWVVNNYGPTNAGLDGTVHFDYPDGGITSVALGNYKLYKRGSRETGAWLQNNPFANAASSIPGNNYIEFANLTSFSQLFPQSIVSPLPVEMVDLQANWNSSNMVDLIWQTVTEQDNAGFHIERSTDAINFDAIGFKQGAENSTSLIDYLHIDRNPLEGVAYYRLKQVDLDGKSTYSNTVRVDSKAKQAVFAYPNPTTGLLHIDISGMGSAVKDIHILDLSGREVMTTLTATNGTDLDISNLENGVYSIVVSSGMYKKQLRIVKM